MDTEFHSPADTSRDSSDTKDSSLEYRVNKNKRKCAEPRKVDERKFDDTPPLKLIKLEPETVSPVNVRYERTCSPSNDVKPSISPFRPWSSDQRPQSSVVSPAIPSGYVPPCAQSFDQEEPLSLVVEKKRNDGEPRSQIDQTEPMYSGRPSVVQVEDLRVNQPRPQEVVRIYDSDEKYNYDAKCTENKLSMMHESNR